MALSIIIPSLNAPTIQATIESIYRQQGLPGEPEVLVVGQDRAGWIQPHPWLRFIETPQALLPGAARNLGASYSSCNILVFLDADIILLPDTLRVLCARLQHYDIVGGSVILEPGHYWQLTRNIMGFSFCSADVPGERRDHLHSMLLACRREAWDHVGAFGSDFWAGEDVEWGSRATGKGCQLLFEPAARSYHRPPLMNWRGHWQRWHYYGQGWAVVYRQVFRHTACFPAYTPRARTEYLARLIDIAQQPHAGARLLNFIIPIWILTVVLRDILIVYRQRSGMMQYWYTAPGLLLLTLAWYLGVHEQLRHLE